MLASKQFGCKAFFQSLILVVLSLSTVLFCDNQSAIKISTDPVTRQRTKHVEIHMHYIWELVHDGTIIMQYCPTDEQIADIFTKSFSKNKFTYLRSLLGVISLG